MKIVISLGGSILAQEELDIEYVKKFSSLVNSLAKKHRIGIVTGGGKPARKYIEKARSLGASETLCDLIGIEASRLNARILSAAIENATIDPPRDFIAASNALDLGKIVVMGGTHPGHSTDAVSALLAEFIGAKLLINATNVSGIYNKDPQKHKDAKMYNRISIDKLVDMIGSYSVGAGKYELIDILAAKIIQRSRIRTIFLDGTNLKNLRNAIEGKKFTGTVIENR